MILEEKYNICDKLTTIIKHIIINSKFLSFSNIQKTSQKEAKIYNIICLILK